MARIAAKIKATIRTEPRLEVIERIVIRSNSICCGE
jgi:hypothetical protein